MTPAVIYDCPGGIIITEIFMESLNYIMIRR